MQVATHFPFWNAADAMSQLLLPMRAMPTRNIDGIGKIAFGQIIYLDLHDQPSLPWRPTADLYGMVEHSPTMFEQPGHGDVVDMTEQVEIGKTGFGQVGEGIAVSIKLPALWF
ncbi:MAG: hypothetical protein HC794_01365 [Nitrospiraceae bacterium]|nr:hypothetical protein [Nitrospiraceae bacterium]